MSELVRISDEGHVRHLILDRPEKRNAFNHDLVLALRDAAREAADDHEVWCVVLRGEGAAFSAGIDVFQLGGLAGTENLRPFRRACIDMVNLLEEMTKPVVAQIHGACLGLGAEIALACDLRVMADDVKFGLPETKLGLIPDVGGSSRLPAVVGLGIAKELLMTGRSIDAAECHRIGAANRIARRRGPRARHAGARRRAARRVAACRGVREARRGRGCQADARGVARAGGRVPADPRRDRRLPRGRRRFHGEARAALHGRPAGRYAEGAGGRDRLASPASSATASSGKTQARYV